MKIWKVADLTLIRFYTGLYIQTCFEYYIISLARREMRTVSLTRSTSPGPCLRWLLQFVNTIQHLIYFFLLKLNNASISGKKRVISGWWRFPDHRLQDRHARHPNQQLVGDHLYRGNSVKIFQLSWPNFNSQGFEPRCTLSNILYGIMYRFRWVSPAKAKYLLKYIRNYVSWNQF